MRRVLVLAAMITLVVAAAADAGKKRPGCGKFCHESGGFGPPPGDAGDPVLDAVEILPQTLDGTRDRIVNVRATCLLEVKCYGAIILRGGKIFEYGRANLRVPALTTVKVPVGLTREALESLEEHGKERNARAHVFLVSEDGPAFGPDYSSKRLTILPPR